MTQKKVHIVILNHSNEVFLINRQEINSWEFPTSNSDLMYDYRLFIKDLVNKINKLFGISAKPLFCIDNLKDDNKIALVFRAMFIEEHKVSKFYRKTCWYSNNTKVIPNIFSREIIQRVICQS